jgi:hypothetical protein
MNRNVTFNAGRGSWQSLADEPEQLGLEAGVLQGSVLFDVVTA